MFNKPIFIAATLTLLAGIPLYLLSAQQFPLNTSNLPLIGLSLFVLLLIAAYWSQAVASRNDSPNNHDTDFNEREVGNVKWFSANKGFGFITSDSGEDVFVHFRSIRGDGHRVLRDGQRVEFSVSEGEKGPQAEDVAVAGT
ncbi:MAG TPA: cold-shock protein [Gammaproteobacteria bacterium]|jgi:CspA family cold shock protein|nr:cold-shock protein [Gammaproteobacteria bacterium]MDP6732709.1 cold-shock protein [Gammaproteobacteria bacterium]HAJ75622.1 cold-shock protein [Gammaproteobacteria bacterium]|tara:strand:- start:1451 stop:1873 length:423 start_codon:yes stop_codon:yes gene_type:complete